MSRANAPKFLRPPKPLSIRYQIDLYNVCRSWYTCLINERLTMDTSNLYYGDDFGYFEEEELSPEEQAAADRAYYRQQEQEAYAEFLQSPYCFDEG